MHYSYPSSTFQQSLHGKAHTIFCHYTENHKLGLDSQTLNERIRVPALKNVQSLFFQKYLLIVEQIFGQLRVRLIRNPHDFIREKGLSPTISAPRVPFTQCGGKILNSGSFGV